MKCVLQALGQLQRWFQVLVPREMYFAGMGGVEKGVRGVGTR